MIRPTADCPTALTKETEHGSGEARWHDKIRPTTSFPLTSFLYGGNADYIEELHAAYRTIRSRSIAEWRDFFARAEGRRRRRQEERRGRLLAGRNWPIAGQWRTGLGARRQLGPGREARREEGQGQGRRQRRGAVRRRRASGDARFGARHHDDPRLPHARPSARQSRPARHRQAARGLQRAVAGDLRLHRGRLRPARSSSTTCWGSNTRPSGRCWRS